MEEIALPYELTPKVLRSYARGCLRVSDGLIEHAAGRDSIILPSRGAYPIVQGVIDALSYRSLYENEAEDLLRSLDAPPFLKLKFNYVRPSEKRKSIRIVPYPATADVSPREKDLKRYEKTINRVVDEIRDYSSKVISTFYLSQSERKEEPHFSLFSFVHRKIERRPHVASYYEELKPIEAPMLVDTVISGRALTTLLKHLDEYLSSDAERPYSIAIVDREGTKLKEPYRSELLKRKFSRKAELVPIERIVTEDRGASLLGIVGIVYPNFAFEVERRCRSLRPAAAVTWHVLPTNKDERIREYNETFNSFRDALKEAIKLEYELNRGGSYREIEMRKDMLRGLAKSLVKRTRKVGENLKRYDLLSYPDPKARIDLFTQLPIEEWNETSSHVIHIYFSEDLLRRLVDDFKRFSL